MATARAGTAGRRAQREPGCPFLGEKGHRRRFTSPGVQDRSTWRPLSVTSRRGEECELVRLGAEGPTPQRGELGGRHGELGGQGATLENRERGSVRAGQRELGRRGSWRGRQGCAPGPRRALGALFSPQQGPGLTERRPPGPGSTASRTRAGVLGAGLLPWGHCSPNALRFLKTDLFILN